MEPTELSEVGSSDYPLPPGGFGILRALVTKGMS